MFSSPQSSQISDSSGLDTKARPGPLMIGPWRATPPQLDFSVFASAN